MGEAEQSAPVRRPSFQFYPGDWLNDTALQMCSLAARGLWADMMCLMHHGRPYGHLVTATGVQIIPAKVALLIRAEPAEVSAALDELEQWGVFSRGSDGVIFSRRMVEDERIRNARAAGGHLGGPHGIKGKAHGVKGAPHGAKGAAAGARGGRPPKDGGGK